MQHKMELSLALRSVIAGRKNKSAAPVVNLNTRTTNEYPLGKVRLVNTKGQAVELAS